VRGRAQPFVSVELLQAFAEAHVVELFHRTRSEAVAAGFFARKMFALDDDGVVAMFGKPIAHRRTRGAAAHDEHVGVAHGQVAEFGGVHRLSA